MGVKLGSETRGYTRFLSVAQVLADAGFEVDLITSSFQHWDKAQRDLRLFPAGLYDFRLVFIPEPGYAKNLDLKRLLSHRRVAKNLRGYLESAKRYDLVYCEIPPNDVAETAARYAEQRDIPFIVDVNDLWPEAMRMVLDVPLVSDVLFFPFLQSAKATYRRVTGIVGTSDEYALRPFAYCEPKTEKLTVYVGNELEQFDAGARQVGGTLKKEEGEFWVSYSGTLGASYDLATMIRASGLLIERGYHAIKFLIIGDGPDKQSLEALASRIDCNATFLGYQDYQTMAAYLMRSDVVVNSLVRKAPQSIVNKIADYLAAGRPLLNTGSSPELIGKIAEEDLGVSVVAEDPEKLADAIEALYKDPEGRRRMGVAARRVAERQFDRKTAYLPIVEMVRRQIGAGRCHST
jgi:glycosyltransferase involved in cell wall biosynthesis